MDDTLHDLSLSARLFDRAGHVMPDGVSHTSRHRQPHPIYMTRARRRYFRVARNVRQIEENHGC